MSKSTVRRVMKKDGLIKSSPRRSGNLTESDADAQKADNLIANQTCRSPWLSGYFHNGAYLLNSITAFQAFRHACPIRAASSRLPI